MGAVYERIADRFADRTRDRKNGLHWANIKGYSPWAMERLAGCRQGDPQSWFFCLPELLPDPFIGILLSVVVYAIGSG